MATLAGNTIAETYPLLLKIDSNGIDGTLRAVQDGDATDSALSIATDSVLVRGSGIRLYFHDADGGEHIAGDGTDLTITSGNDIVLAGTAVNITADTIDLSDATKDVTLNASVDALNFDSNTLSIDASNNRIGIGTASPNHTLDIETTATQPTLRLFSTIAPDGSKTGGTLRLGLHQDNDTGSGANDTQDGDVLGKILFEGQGTDYSYQGGIIQVEVETGDGTATRTEQGTQMSFWTMDTSGASAERRMTIDEDGNVVIPGGELQNNSGEFTFRNTTDGENISFRTQAANTERLKIHSGGNVEVKTGDLVIGTAGKGISFAATSDGTTMSSEILDDYEEGTYTGAITIATGTMDVGGIYDTLSYTKIGDVVHIFGQLVLSAPSGDASGATSLNLPFTAVNLTDLGGAATQAGLIYLNGSAITNGLFTTYNVILEGTASCRIFFVDAGASTTENIGDNHAGEGSDIFINLTYKAA